MSSPFEDLWTYIQANLKGGIEIKNWTAFRGYLGDTMTITNVLDGHIDVDAPKATTTQVIPKDDFEYLWTVWTDYKDKKLQRHELRNMTRFSKYTISIFHWYELEASHD